MLEATDDAKTDGDDGTYAMRVLMLSGSNERMLRPSNDISPDAKGIIFSSAKHKLVLPEPAAPTTATRLPGCTPKLTFDREATPGIGGSDGGVDDWGRGGTWTVATLASTNAMNEIEEGGERSSEEALGCWGE